jgi:NAD(P)H-hydrate epimerase
LTPHPGEFARLAETPPTGGPEEFAAQAAKLCERDSSHKTVVVLKGNQSVICDGEQFAVNQTGNPGMATGGTGDCLTGVIAGLLGQKLGRWEAARLGVHVHGLAGDLAAKEFGQVGMVASDLLTYLPRAFESVAASGSARG